MSEPIRINKAMALAGVASRREADRLIQAGLVRLNGEPVRSPGVQVRPGEDRLEVSGRELRWPRSTATQVWALYKPKRCVCTLSDPEGRATIKDHFPRSSVRLFPVGRLDYDAEGLLLLTNDGDLAQRIAHPSHGVARVYLVKVKGLVTPEELATLRKGPDLDGRRRQPVRVRLLHTRNDKTWLEVTLREGINHHIKKLFAAVGHLVLKIKRYQIGAVELGEMRPGESRRLTEAELSSLRGEGGSGRSDSGGLPRASLA